jgi:DNA-binding MarR family transcriptional regulator
MTESIRDEIVDPALRDGLGRMQRLLGSRRIFASMVGAAGADATQQGVDILAVLADGAARPIGEVARLARLDGGAVSRQLTRLEADGYVRRDGAGRGSVVLVAATRQGRALLEKVEAVRNHQLQRALSAWTADEQAELGRLLLRLADDLQGAPYLPVR